MNSRPHYSKEAFGAAFLALKEAQKISYRQLARMTKLSATHLNNVALGKAGPPRMESMERIAQALHIDPMYFLEYRVHKAKQLVELPRFADMVIDAHEKETRQKRKVSG